MARNIDIGIQKTVVAKLVERGMAEAAATALAAANMATAKTTFQSALSSQGKISEDAYDHAFDVLKDWAQTL